MRNRTGSIRRGVAAGVVALALVLALPASLADAGGVAVLESGGRRMGNANAGGAAEAQDASTVWWNPAGMVRIGRAQVVAAAHAALPDLAYRDDGSLDVGGSPMTGGNGGNGGQSAIIPNLFAQAAIGPRWRVGIGVNTPYALSTDYPTDWVGRYHATHSEIVSINVNPSAAFRLSRTVSIGAGINASYIDATIENQIDFGALLGSPQAADGSVSISGEDWGFGWNVGLLLEPSCCTRIGLAYRSRIKHTLEGRGDFTVPAPAAPVAAATGRFVDTDATAEIELPDTFSASIWHRLNRQWSVMADATWTRWRTFDELVVDFANPAEPNSVLDLDWKNTIRYAVGATFEPNRCWTFRLGGMYDPGAVPTSTRSPRVPGNDRFWLAAGVGYRVNARMAIDLSYAHVFLADAKIRRAAVPPATGSLVGGYESSIGILSLQVTLDF